MASRTLSQLKERIAGEDAAGALNWFRVDSVLEAPNITTYTKYYAMQVDPPPHPHLWVGVGRLEGPAGARGDWGGVYGGRRYWV